MSRSSLVSCLVAAFGLLAACGGGDSITAKLTVTLSGSSRATLDPFQSAVGVAKLRVTVAGTGAGDNASVDLAANERTASFEPFAFVSDELKGTSVRVTVEGFDALGNVVAYGRVDRQKIEGDTTVDVAVRRNLAYVIHKDNPMQAKPASQIYVIDLAARTLVEKVTIPGNDPKARGITARGGKQLLVNYSDGGQGYLGLLSADDHSWRSIQLKHVQDLTVGDSSEPIGLVVGGSRLAFVDFEAGTAEEYKADVTGDGMEVGGDALDMAIGKEGTAAVAILSGQDGFVYMDLKSKELKRRSLDSPGGVALTADGKTAYVTSKSTAVVLPLDMEAGTQGDLISAFAQPTGIATYADALPGVLGLYSNPMGQAARVLPWQDGGAPYSFADGVEVLDLPSGIAVDGPGRRLIVVCEGLMPSEAGLSVIDTEDPGNNDDVLPAVGSKALYPLDPTDMVANVRQRYQPTGVAVVYGR